MIKEFWGYKKLNIKLSGALTTMGAIFLAIPKNENVVAQEALLYIQFFWIVIIIISISITLIQLFIFILQFENKTKDRLEIDFENIISFGFIMFSLVFIYNLIKYTLVTYNTPMFKLRYLFVYIIWGLIGPIYAHVEKKLLSRYISKNRFVFIVSDIIFSIFCSLVVFLIDFIILAHDFNDPYLIFKFSSIILVVFLLTTLLRLSTDFKKRRSYKTI